MSNSRQCKQFKDKELDSKKCSRQNPQTRENDRKNTLKGMNKLRQSQVFCLRERNEKKKKRKNTLQLEKERLSKQLSRKKYRNAEKELDKICKAQKRSTTVFTAHEKELSKKKNQGHSLDQCIQKFHNQLKMSQFMHALVVIKLGFLKVLLRWSL